MKFYLIDKLSNKAAGPYETKLEAQQELEQLIKMVSNAIQNMTPGVNFKATEQLDETVVSANGNVVAKYEIIESTQFDHPELIPEEFK